MSLRDGKYYGDMLPANFDAGYDSHIRGNGSGFTPHAYFPGRQQIGNESGANGPLYAARPSAGMVIEINRRHVRGGPYRVYPA